jgi:hypothetical protein
MKLKERKIASQRSSAKRKIWLRLLGASILAIILTLSVLAQGTAPESIFLDLSLEFLDKYELPKSQFKDTVVGGLSGIVYDREVDRFYAISDDRRQPGSPRFYTLKLDIDRNNAGNIDLQKVEIKDVSFLTDPDGNNFAPGTTDTESIALTPQRSLFVASEGDSNRDIDPFVKEFDLKTGRQLQGLPIPNRYLPNLTAINGQPETVSGVENNLAFESLTIPPGGDPLRVYTATESALLQDKAPVKTTRHGNEIDFKVGTKSRVLHYLINNDGPQLVAEYIYPLESSPGIAIKHGLAELLSLDQEGHFLALERSFSLLGFDVRIFQAVIGGATDTSEIYKLSDRSEKIEPMAKQLVLDLDERRIGIDNLEGMTLGPTLPDGTQSLVLISDDNFRREQKTQLLLFRLGGKQINIEPR